MFAAGPLATTVRFEGFHGASYALLVAGFVALGLWLAAFAFRWWRTRPDLPKAGPEISELPPAPESPAVVSFLVNNWRVTPGAIAATLVDLAARRVLGLDLVGHDDTVVRLRDQPAAGSLTKYEEQVYRLVASRATGGSAPIEAISLGEEGEAHGFRKRFEKAVSDEARDRGLARRRWELIDFVIVGVGLAFVFGFFALALGIAHAGEHPGEKGSMSPTDWLGAGGVAWLVAMALVTRSQALTDTPAGKVTCARWLGLRDYFRHSHAFDNQPPASVAIWDRLLAYGVATGAARDAVRGLPIVAEDPHSAWSRSGGAWHELHIAYPERFSFGHKPLNVFLEGIVRTVFWGGIAYFILPVVSVIGWGILRDELDKATFNSAGLNALIAFLGGLVAIVGLYLSARTFGGLVRLVRGGLDLGKTRVIEGDVVKVHLNRFAIDDGHLNSATALFEPPLGPHVGRGDRVRAVVSPHLRYLSKLEVLAPASVPAAVAALPPETGVPAVTAAGPAIAAASLASLTPQALHDATGFAFQPAAARGGHDSTAGAPGPMVAIQQFEDGTGNRLAVTLTAPMPIAGPMFSLVSRMASRGGAEVPGLGDSASWVRDRALVVIAHGQMLSIDADFPGSPPEQRLQAARNIAKLVLSGPAS